MLLLVKCYDNKKVKSPYNLVTSRLTQPGVANKQKQLKKGQVEKFHVDDMLIHSEKQPLNSL